MDWLDSLDLISLKFYLNQKINKPNNVGQNFENPLKMLQKCKKLIEKCHFWGSLGTFRLKGTGRFAPRTSKLRLSYN
jgi:hypothetical protein